MPAPQMPSGRYLTCAVDVSPDYGGQTRALLMRNRILAREAGLRPSVLTFSAANDYDQRRQICLERGLLLPEISLLNIYEHYRDHDWRDPEPTGEPLADLSSHRTAEEHFPDGTPWRTTYQLPTGETVHDFLRQDGSVYLRVPAFTFKDAATWPDALTQVSKDGEVVGSFRSLGQWFRRWVRELTEDDERAFVFMDSRYVVPHLVPMQAPRIHLVYLMHNIHVSIPRRWDSPINEVYERVLDRVPGMDAMVTLTRRQRDDIAQRRGDTNNLFVVPNPVDLPEPQPNVPRDPKLATVVARLEPQKRLFHAVAAFAEVLERVPDARLDIYGSGSRFQPLQEEIDRRGLSGSITLRGHDPHAREALWRSSAFLMTSSFEGYPLSTLESLSHGCPVVSYDIKYGPREQITDGVDGFLVPEGDVHQLADRLVRLLQSPELVERMSAAALEKARMHGTERFLSDWAAVLQQAVEQKRHRTAIADAALEVTRCSVGRGGIIGAVRRRDPASSYGRFGLDDVLTLEGLLRVTPKGRSRDLSTARVEVAAVHRRSGEVVDIPVTVTRSGSELGLWVHVRLGDVLGPGEDSEVVQIRVRLVWQNSSWETFVSRPAEHISEVEVGYREDGTMTLTRPGRSAATDPAVG